MIDSDVKFIMNGANHLTKAISSYPFQIFEHGWEAAIEGKECPKKGELISARCMDRL